MQEKHIKMLGVALIAVGLVMLLFTFYLAYTYLKSPYPSLSIPETSDASGQPDVNQAIAQAFYPFFNSILPLAFSSSYLLVMGLVGFWTLGRGIQIIK